MSSKRSQYAQWINDQARQAAQHRESAGRWERAGDRAQERLNAHAATRYESASQTSFKDWLELFG